MLADLLIHIFGAGSVLFSMTSSAAAAASTIGTAPPVVGGWDTVSRLLESRLNVLQRLPFSSPFFGVAGSPVISNYIT